jgi:transcriptional regulator with XRE-family HTH domain
MTDGWAGAEAAGELIARARERLGKSQYALAEALREACGRGDGIPDRTMVARWETGRRIPTPYWRTYLAAVLQLPPSVLDQAAAVSKARRAGGQQADGPRPAERLRFALAHPGSVDLLSVAHLREQVRRLDERYVHVPSTALIPEAGHCLGQIVFLGSHARRPYVRRELHAAEAEAATLMGQLVWDASQRRDHDAAVAYFDQAIEAARQRGDESAEGLALLRKSFVALYGRRDPQAGLTLTGLAGRAAGGTSQVLAGLATLHAAEAHAMLGSRRDCEEALGAAATSSAASTPATQRSTCSLRRSQAGSPAPVTSSSTTPRPPSPSWNRPPGSFRTSPRPRPSSSATWPSPTSGSAAATQPSPGCIRRSTSRAE